MNQLITWRVGDGSQILFWQDPWLPCGPFVKILGRKLVQNLGSNLNAKVRDFYYSSQWLSYAANNLSRKDRVKESDLQRLTAYIPLRIIFHQNVDDEIIWRPNQRGTYSIKSTWEATRTCAHKVPWRKLIWFKESMPRFAFTM